MAHISSRHVIAAHFITRSAHAISAPALLPSRPSRDVDRAVMPLSTATGWSGRRSKTCPLPVAVCSPPSGFVF
jgi:hypothetical protein